MILTEKFLCHPTSTTHSGRPIVRQRVRKRRGWRQWAQSALMLTAPSKMR
jgi:hypothetical protein